MSSIGVIIISINTKNLKEFWFRPTKHIFKDLNESVLDKGRIDKHRIFIDRGSDVLIIAHLDTVQKPKWDKLSRNILYASGLDDRLGCFLAYKVAEELGLDLLLTDHEERGGTTGMFHTLKDYNWIAEFDRGGADVVTYDLDCPEFLDALDEFFGVEQGLYSDICSLDTTACCVNVGVGYDRGSAHDKKSFADLSVTADQMKRFKEFYVVHKDHKFVRAERDYRDDWDQPGSYGANRYWDQCDICGNDNAKEIFGYLLCFDCVQYMMESETLINGIQDKEYQLERG
jgi:hypothetical protein